MSSLKKKELENVRRSKSTEYAEIFKGEKDLNEESVEENEDAGSSGSSGDEIA